MLQWLRKARVTFSGSISGFVINPGPVMTHELHVSFYVSRTISGSPNTFQVSIWNMNESHRNSVGNELDTIKLEAGYMPSSGDNNVSIIASGQIRDVEHERSGADIVTTISCGDGDAAYRKATISKTIPAGSSVKDVVDVIYNEMKKNGINKGQFTFPNNMKTFVRPYSMCGSCVRELDLLGRGNKFYWSIQNGAMEIIPGNGFLPGETMVTPDSGLIDMPIITDNGVKVKSLLNPNIRPNRLIRVNSELLNFPGQGNLYRVSQVDFDGDNVEGSFTSLVHGEAVNGKTVNEGKTK